MTRSIAIGPLSRKGKASHYKPPEVKFDIPQKITNSSAKETYKPPSWGVRSGADDHKQFSSKGLSV